MGLSIYEINNNAENLWLDNNLTLAKSIFLNQANQAPGLNAIGNMAVDAFNDSTGIDATNSINYTYNGTTDLVQANSGTGKTFTTNGDAKIISSMTSSTGIGYFNGSSRVTYLDSADFAFGSGDFTIEGWFNFPTVTNCYLFGQFNASEYSPVDVQLWSNKLGIDASTNGSTFISGFNNAYGATTILANTPYHIAVVRNGTTMTLYLNGNVEYSASISTTTLWDTTENFVLGARKADYPTTAYIDEFRVTKGIARYTATFTPPTSAFTADTNTVLLVHMDTDFTDDVGATGHTAKAPTVTSAVITTVNKKFGNGALALDGTGDYLSFDNHADFNVGSGDFTIECWVKRNVIGAVHMISGLINSTGSPLTNIMFDWQIQANNTVLCQLYSGTTEYNVLSTGTITDTNKWYHLAVVRYNNSAKMYIDGVASGNAVNLTGVTINFPNFKLSVGRMGEYNGYYMNGYIDEFRFSKGIARYTANFTPSTIAFENDVNTKLLLHADSSVGITGAVDSSALPVIYSNVITSTIVPSKIFISADETLESRKVITYYASRDGGTTWTACVKDILTDISSQPSGTSIKVKVNVSGGTSSTLKSWAFSWK